MQFVFLKSIMLYCYLWAFLLFQEIVLELVANSPTQGQEPGSEEQKTGWESMKLENSSK